MRRMEIDEHYFFELGKCKHYELKYKKYVETDQEKFEKYFKKYRDHKKMAAKYYMMMKEEPMYVEGLNDESICSDSRYFESTAAAK